MNKVSRSWRRLFLTLTLSLVAILSFNSVANAGTILSYSGKGIWNKASVNTGEVPSTYTSCTVRHTQKRNYGRNVALSVKIQKKSAAIFWDTVGEYIYYNDVTNDTNFSRNLTAGTYRLYFSASSADQACDINGSFYY